MILKSELKQVPVEQRVPGRIYGVADRLGGKLQIMAFHKEGYYDTADASWNLWFALPESLLPVREVLPDEFKLKQGEWEYTDKNGEYTIIPMNSTFRRIKPSLPELTIPSGSKSEQIEQLEKILSELKQS